MSVIKPEIDDLLEQTDHNPFLLCSVASKRACDINNMLRGQHLRVTAIQDVDDITTVVSMDEIANGTLGYVQEDFDEAIKDTNTKIGE